jgi:hypothetical protein
MRCAVSKAAHARGFGTSEEVLPVGDEQRIEIVRANEIAPSESDREREIRMNPIAKRLRAGVVHTVFLVAGLIGLAANPLPSAESAKPDFWQRPASLVGQK